MPGYLYLFGYCDMKHTYELEWVPKEILSTSTLLSFPVDMKSTLKWASLWSCILVKSTFYCFLSEKTIFRITCWPEINILLFFEVETKIFAFKGWSLFWASFLAIQSEKADYNLNLTRVDFHMILQL